MTTPAAIATDATASRPTAIGAPPPRGVGTECDDRPPGTSSIPRLRSSAIVGGSAASHDRAAGQRLPRSRCPPSRSAC